MKLFTGYRPNPRPEYVGAGLTNNGETADYQGVVFDDGTVVLRWLTEFRSHSVWNNYDDFYHVHGHPEYGTRIEWVGLDYDGQTFEARQDLAADF